MEQIEGPEIDGSAGQVGTTRSQRHNRAPIENSGGFHAEFVSRRASNRALGAVTGYQEHPSRILRLTAGELNSSP